MAFLIDINRDVTEVEPKNGENFTLEELYALIGCDMIQICDAHERGKILIFDEEGMLKDLPVNTEATLGMHEDMMPFVFNAIYGKAVMCKSGELR